MNYSNTMKTIESDLLRADPIMTEVRHAKTALAAKYNFDVAAMVRALQEREQQEKADNKGSSRSSLRKSN